METGYKGIVGKAALLTTDESENILISGKAKELWEQSKGKIDGVETGFFMKEGFRRPMDAIKMERDAEFLKYVVYGECKVVL